MTGRGRAARWTIHGSAVMGVNLKISIGRTHKSVYTHTHTLLGQEAPVKLTAV